MAVSEQKSVERYFAEMAAMKLGEDWRIDSEARESPDFLIWAEDLRFGLEVTDCHIGGTTKKGSTLLRAEKSNQEWMRALRSEVERHVRSSLNVRYHGPASAQARNEILKFLLAQQFDEASEFASFNHRLTEGLLFVFKARDPSWNFADNQTGPTSSDGTILQKRIDDKSRKLENYRKTVSDVRLLVVATKAYNSGRLVLDDAFTPELKGFDVVYFFEYPSRVRSFLTRS